MNEQANRYLAEEPVGPLMLKFSIPCIMSLLVSALYNIAVSYTHLTLPTKA